MHGSITDVVLLAFEVFDFGFDLQRINRQQQRLWPTPLLRLARFAVVIINLT